MNPIAIIPAYNSESYLAKLIPEVGNYIPDILVVDDGSTDATSSTAESLGATVLRHPTNRGKGAALKTGFAYALENNFNPILTLDSDGQHDPQYITAFLQTYEQAGSDLIIGSRILDKLICPGKGASPIGQPRICYLCF